MLLITLGVVLSIGRALRVDFNYCILVTRRPLRCGQLKSSRRSCVLLHLRNIIRYLAQKIEGIPLRKRSLVVLNVIFLLEVLAQDVLRRLEHCMRLGLLLRVDESLRSSHSLELLIRELVLINQDAVPLLKICGVSLQVGEIRV